MTSKTFVIRWSKTGLVWTTHSLMSAKILDSNILVFSLHGNAVSPGHVIRAGLQNGTMSAWARPGKNFRPYWILRRLIEHSGSPQSMMQLRDLDILYMVKTDGSVDAAERLHLPLPPTPSVTVTPPPPGSLVLLFRPQNRLPTHSDVIICACTPRFIPRMAMLFLGNRPITGTLPRQSPPWCPLMILFLFSDSLSEIKRMMSGCS